MVSLAVVAAGAVVALAVSAFLWHVVFPTLAMRWRLRKLPGPYSIPFIGNLPSVAKLNFHEFNRRAWQQYGPIVSIWFGGLPWVLVSDPDLCRKVMFRFNNRKEFPQVLEGDNKEVDVKGLVFAKDVHWRIARRAWEPAVTYPDSLKGYFPGMQGSARTLCSLLASRGDGCEVDIWRELQKMTLEVVGTAAFGVDFNTMSEATLPSAPSQQIDGKVLQEAVIQAFRQMQVDQASAYLPLILMFPTLEKLIIKLAMLLPDAKCTAGLKARGCITETGRKLVEQWRAAGKAGSGAAEQQQQGRPRRGPVAPGSFLGLVLAARDKESGQTLTDLEVVAQASTFLLAGMETTANALAFAIYLLAQHPEAEARLVAEVQALAAAKAGAGDTARAGLPDLVPEDLERLPFTGAVLSEAMRLYTPTAFTGREAAEDIQLGDYVIPKGVNIIVCVYNIHRNPAYWPEPESFLPERFLPEGQHLAQRHPHAYLSFGAGPRMCVGYKFALQEARLALAQLYSSFSFRLTAGQVPLPLVHGLTLGPKHGIKVTVHHRGA